MDCEICVDEVKCAPKVLKLGKSDGVEDLDPEHIVFGDNSIKVWLKKGFNSILYFKQVSECLKVGLVVPICKGKGKDPRLVSSYRDITLSSMIAKLFEIIVLRHFTPCFKKGHIGIVEKVQETSPGTGMRNRAITVLHELWCVLESRDTPTSHCVQVNKRDFLIPTSIPFRCSCVCYVHLYTCTCIQ